MSLNKKGLERLHLQGNGLTGGRQHSSGRFGHWPGEGASRGAEALIRSGEKELEVSATLESGETLCRRRTPRSQIVEINGKRVPVDAAETFLSKQFGSADVLSAVLNADRFVEMPEAEQQKFLAQLVEAGKVEIPAEICDALRAINAEPPKLASVDDVESAHKRFYALRTESSRALKALGHMENPDIPSDLPSVQEVRSKLEELRQQKKRLIAQKAEADACWQNAQARLAQWHAEVDDASSEILSPTEEQELSEVESQRSHVETLRQELAELLAEQKTLESACATLQKIKGKCSTCQQAISAGAKTAGLGVLRERLADVEGQIQGAREEINEFCDLEAARSRLEAHRRATARRAKLLEEQSKVQGAQKPETRDLESRMTILAERINKGERVLERAQQVHSSQERWEAYVREKSSLEARIQQLDRVVEFLGPNGAMMEQAKDRVGSFLESLNRQLAAFAYACNLTIEPFEIGIASSNHRGSGLTLKQLSESERFRFSIAFQIALATVTRLRFVVMDRADLLDNERRKVLTSLLINSQLDQAVVLATGEGGPPPLVPQGVKFLGLSEEKKADQVLVSAAG
jgi:DNA repair exonuclease SbcCD ATPase subunit